MPCTTHARLQRLCAQDEPLKKLKLSQCDIDDKWADASADSVVQYLSSTRRSQ